MHKTDAWQMGKLQQKEKKNKLMCLQHKRVVLDFLSYWYLTGRCLCLAFKHGGVPDLPSTHTHSEVKHTQPAAKFVQAQKANPGVSLPVPRPICAHRDVPSCSPMGQGGWQRTSRCRPQDKDEAREPSLQVWHSEHKI